MIAGPRTGPLTEDDLLEVYPWPEDRTWVRAMMVTTLDGAAAGPDGLSGSISGEADETVFSAVRRLADAVLVGAGTFRAERYGPLEARPEDAGRRAGRAPAPVLVVVSGSLDLPWDEKAWSESDQRPVVVTGPDADAGRRTEAEKHCEVVTVTTDSLARGAVDLLVERGLRRIVCEGGPTLLEELVGAGVVDEADITVSPVFAGTAESPRTPGLDAVARFRLAHVISGDDFLMNRYVRESGS